MTLSPATLNLQAYQSAPRWLVAYSGGVDSHVLLHLLVQLRDRQPDALPELLAIHVDHQLQAQSASWEQHCQQVCDALGVKLVSEAVNIVREGGESLEALAREARYRVFEKHLRAGDVLMLAHHLDDQLETCLQRTLRGSGVLGMQAMASERELADGLLLRPVLEVTRADIETYARAQGLQWIEDPSNLDDSFSRNFLRRELLPKIEQRWPQYRQTLARSIRLSQESAELNRQLAEMDCERAGIDLETELLPLQNILLLSTARLKNLLRYWLQQRGWPLPSAACLEALVDELIHAVDDADPVIKWGGVEAHRYNGQLHVIRQLPELDVRREYYWQPGHPLLLENNGQLHAEPASGEGMKHLPELAVRYRRGGERCQPAGRNHSQTLKKLFQEYRVPSWLRDRVPLLYDGEQLVAVAGYWICEPYRAAPGEQGLDIIWRQE